MKPESVSTAMNATPMSPIMSAVDDPKTRYAQINIPDRVDKFQHVIQSEEEPDNEHLQPDNNSRKEWIMIISVIHMPFEFSVATSPSHHD